MSYLRHIQACNPQIDEVFWPWQIAGQRIGWVRPAFAEHLRAYPRVFDVQQGQVDLLPQWRGFEAISEGLAQVAEGLARDTIIPPLLGEPYPVTPAGREQAIAKVDRVAASYLGLRSFGQHLNGYVREGAELSMWIGRRARDRLLYPGALDNLVAGGLPYGLSLQVNLVKECQEEAGMAPDLARQARPVGIVSYNRVARRGFRPDVLYCYDLELAQDFVPRNVDGEVEEFLLLPVSEVMRIVRDTDDFKSNCNLVIIDFLMRHGLLGPEHKDYLAIAGGLRQPPGMFRSS